MCAPGSVRESANEKVSEMTKEEIISALHSKAKEVAALSDNEVLAIAKEMYAHFQTTEHEWSMAGNWVQREITTLKLNPESKAPDAVGNYARVQGAAIRGGVSNAMHSYISSTIKALEDRIRRSESPEGDAKSAVELISNKREIETAEGTVEVHGPSAIPMLPGVSFETWSSPSGIPTKDSKVEQKEGACLVLGAGNQAVLSAMDTLHCFFVLRRPVLLKHHPLRPHLIHPYAILFEGLMQRGYFNQVLDEGILQTESMLKNTGVGHVHVTGAYHTACAIEKTLLRVRRDVKSLEDATSMLTSELGCATPWIFAPGEYTDSELRNAAKAFVTSKKTNGGSNCLCGQVLVMPKEWSQKYDFREILEEEIVSTPKDPVYYPGSLKKRDSALSEYSNHGRRRSSVLKSQSVVGGSGEEESDDLVVVECGTPGEEGFNGFSLQTEAFGPVVAIVELPGGEDGTDPAEYMENAVAPFVNDKEKLFGTLSCTLLWPDSISATGSGATDARLVSAIASLQYGTVAVNVWSLLGYPAAMIGGTWGGHPRDNLRHSGSGQIGNQFGLPIEKTIVYGPPLKTSPLLDKNKTPPGIVHDVIHAISVSPSTSRAVFRVWCLLAIRAAQFVLPKFTTRWVFGDRLYASPL